MNWNQETGLRPIIKKCLGRLIGYACPPLLFPQFIRTHGVTLYRIRGPDTALLGASL